MVKSEEKADRHQNGFRFHSLFSASRDGIVFTIDRGRYIDANPAAAAIFGLPEDQLIGRRDLDFMRPEPGSDSLPAEFAEKGVFQGEHTLVRADGTVIDVDLFAIAHLEPGLHLCVIRDISERKRKGRALRESEERGKQLLDRAPDAVLIHQDGGIVYCNAAALRLYQADSLDLLQARPPFELVHPEEREIAKTKINRVLQGAYVTSRECPVSSRNIALQFDQGGIPILLFFLMPNNK